MITRRQVTIRSHRPKNRPVDEGRPKLQVWQRGLEMRLADVLVGDGVDCSRSVNDATQMIDQHERNDATATKRKAGAMAWEITSES